MSLQPRTNSRLYILRDWFLTITRAQTNSEYANLHNLENAVFNDKQNDEFTVRIAHNVEEACRLIESGFKYVTGDYTDDKTFRKRK